MLIVCCTTGVGIGGGRETAELADYGVVLTRKQVPLGKCVTLSLNQLHRREKQTLPINRKGFWPLRFASEQCALVKTNVM